MYYRKSINRPGDLTIGVLHGLLLAFHGDDEDEDEDEG